MQVFLQGKLLGVQEFLLAPADAAVHSEAAESSDPAPLSDPASFSNNDQLFLGRSHWISLLCEVLPRALLNELGLANILLGSSGGGQFLVLLPEEAMAQAEAFLSAAAQQILELSRGAVRLIWSATENLGDWSDVRKRLNDGMERLRNAPGFSVAAAVPLGEPTEASAGTPADVAPSAVINADAYFASELGWKLRTAASVGWSPASPGKILLEEGKHVWDLARPGSHSPSALPFARQTALADQQETGSENASPAPTSVLASRASGTPSWGVLRGDVDNFGIRIRRAQSVEEHLQLSVMYKQFFAGELEVQCSLPDYFRKVSVIHSGGDDFALFGSWDALIGLAREMERVFHLFVDHNLKEFPGPEGKTITLALALAPAPDASLGSVFEEAGRRLEAAKATGKDCFSLLGRTLEWKQFSEAVDLKTLLLRMVSDFGCSPQYLRDLCGVYRETQSKISKRQARRSGGERPWRYHRRLRRILSAARPTTGRVSQRGDFQKAQTELIADLIGRSAVTVKLRPAGRVALEWARLSSS